MAVMAFYLISGFIWIAVFDGDPDMYIFLLVVIGIIMLIAKGLKSVHSFLKGKLV